jgi:hypothetical protein
LETFTVLYSNDKFKECRIIHKDKRLCIIFKRQHSRVRLFNDNKLFRGEVWERGCVVDWIELISLIKLMK